MMYFLGTAGNYTAGDTLRHLFAVGGKQKFKELKAYLAARYGTTADHVALYHTGRSALCQAIKSTVPAGSGVVVTALTCTAVVQAVRAAGCVPVYADIDQNTLHYGGEELEVALARAGGGAAGGKGAADGAKASKDGGAKGATDAQVAGAKAASAPLEVKAVIVQNNLGIPADIQAIERICQQHQLVLIEDLAHSAGMYYKDGREAGTVGRVVALSFGKGKAVDTISGGAVIFTSQSDPAILQPRRRPSLPDRLRDRWYPVFGALIRGLYRLGPLGRYLTSLLVKIHWIERSADAKLDTERRLTYWQAGLALRQLQLLQGQRLRPLREHYLVRDRQRVLAELARRGFIFHDIWYDVPVSPERYYRQSGLIEADCPVATRVAQQIVNVPTHYDKEAMQPAVEIISEHLAEGSAPVAGTAAAERAAVAAEREAQRQAELKEAAVEQAEREAERQRAQEIKEKIEKAQQAEAELEAKQAKPKADSAAKPKTEAKAAKAKAEAVETKAGAKSAKSAKSTKTVKATKPPLAEEQENTLYIGRDTATSRRLGAKQDEHRPVKMSEMSVGAGSAAKGQKPARKGKHGKK